MRVESLQIQTVVKGQGVHRVVKWSLVFILITVLVSLAPIAVKGRLQLLLLPCLLVVIARVRIFEQRVPRIVIVGAAAGMVLGAIVQFSHVSLDSGAFVVSTVSDEDLRQQTKIYRDRLRRSVQAGGESLVGIHWGLIRDSSSAQRVLAKSPSLAGVIWGSSRWMSVTLRHYDPLTFSSFPAHSVGRELLSSLGTPELMLTRSVPSIGMSHGHERGTVHFLGQVVKAWRAVPMMTNFRADSGEFEGELEALARMQARWTSRSHLALPLWLSGTVHLVRAVEGQAVQIGELQCAVDQLRGALAQFRTHDNPALEMSVRSNYAIALLVQSQYEQEGRKLRKKAMHQLAAAVKLRKHDENVGAVATVNYLGLVQAQKRSAKHGRRK
jgi:hypothetical protein